MMKFEIFDIRDFTEKEYIFTCESMSESRKNRLERYKNSDDKLRMASAESRLKKLIAELSGEKTENVKVDNLPSGKPLALVNGKKFSVSISHSGNFVAVAVADSDIGIDIETRESISKALIDRALCDDEKAYVGEFSHKRGKEQRTKFLRVWTAKEAYLKLTGEGLSMLHKVNTMPFIENSACGYEIFCEVTEDYVCTVIGKK
ncbi:MAG: 4'-phosphopantetheinyl transferase superfamily protein [Ruminococcaceae bacterium]|nr:4'-phosphopantetheinyl transferase superfamily protein [Oscillospiraceae bacterium]